MQKTRCFRRKLWGVVKNSMVSISPVASFWKDSPTCSASNRPYETWQLHEGANGSARHFAVRASNDKQNASDTHVTWGLARISLRRQFPNSKAAAKSLLQTNAKETRNLIELKRVTHLSNQMFSVRLPSVRSSILRSSKTFSAFHRGFINF